MSSFHNWWDFDDKELISIAGHTNVESFIWDWASAALVSSAVKGDLKLYRKGYIGWLYEKDAFDYVNKKMKISGGNLIYEATVKHEDAPNSYVWSFRNGVIRVSIEQESKIGVALLTNDRDLVRACDEYFGILQREIETVQTPVFVLGHTSNGIETVNIGSPGHPFTYKNYAKPIGEGYDKLRDDLKSKTPGGRLGIITGPPGVGKTYLLRGLIEDVQAVFILVPPDMLAHISDPQLISTLASTKQYEAHEAPVVLMVEDADMALLPRAADNLGAVSNILNATSGIIGDLIDIRIIATTNAKNVEIDQALVRKGRISTQIGIGLINSDHAMEISKRLLKDDATTIWSDSISLADVYADAREKGWKPPRVSRRLGQPYARKVPPTGLDAEFAS